MSLKDILLKKLIKPKRGDNIVDLGSGDGRLLIIAIKEFKAKKAVGIEAPPPASLQGLMEKETRCKLLPADTRAVKRYMETTLTTQVK